MKLKEVKSLYAADASARQLLAVEYIGGSEARVRYYVKREGSWWLLHRGNAYVGKNGLGKAAEGDARTPVGELRPLFAFGIKPDPGSKLPYLRVKEGTLACDSEGPWYNRIVDLNEADSSLALRMTGERMWELSPEYDYGLQTDFNSACVYPLGSAIFIHCKGKKAWTGGCVALDKRMMRAILRTADQGLRIFVYQ